MRIFAGLAVLALLVVAAPADAQTTDADALSKARAIGNKARSERRFYDRKFDLSGLPAYTPERQVAGTIRQWGNNYLEDSGLMAVWEAAFRRYHPGIRFENNLYSSSVAFPGLIAGVADIAPMGRQALWDELKGLEREGAKGGEEGVGETEVVEIVMATGSYNVRGWTFALGVFVHKDNPIAQLTIEQLDGILGARRDGGWNGLTWDTSVARGPEKDIRTWGQLGLTGEWADKPIMVYGYNAKYHFNDEIDKKVLKGSGRWTEQMRAFSNAAGLKTDGSLTAGGELLMNGLANDRYGIAYTGIPFLNDRTKPIALSGDDGKTFVPLTLETVQDRTYPLIRDVYYYFKREHGKPVDPKIKEFLRFVLSREGQQAIQADGKYLPLTPAAARAQLSKLE
ncbi:phosphate ABC transporter substrate-binding protein [Sphingomonas gilva]|uniref:Phosphate ABC transporter substrate-binding protein n=1 Tax=Sphingomonas gilva TaxID=2305907 RepID=A0A396RNY7_9SPHN|nr:substrate-binding domain-containing protein [Sphingomonas gilva]RHW18210.1 phosphate ABC transporter substrate-binding protein [Sphingomonas gilva]